VVHYFCLADFNERHFRIFSLGNAAGWDASIEHVRTVAVNRLVIFEIFYLFNSRYITAPVFNRARFTGNPYVLMAIAVLVTFQLYFTCLLLLQTLFGTVVIGIDIWLRIVLITSTVLFLVEIEKVFLRYK